MDLSAVLSANSSPIKIRMISICMRLAAAAPSRRTAAGRAEERRGDPILQDRQNSRRIFTQTDEL